MTVAVQQVLIQCPIIIGQAAAVIIDFLLYIGVTMTEYEKDELVSKLTNYYNSALTDGANVIYEDRSPHDKIAKYIEKLFSDDLGNLKGSHQEAFEVVGYVYIEGLKEWATLHKQTRKTLYNG